MIAHTTSATGHRQPPVSAMDSAIAPSQHLAKLRLAGLVTLRRDGQRTLYRARGGHVRLLAEVMNAADHHVHGIPDHD
jgi:DNA-binding transcriptional ArsR family regulator